MRNEVRFNQILLPDGTTYRAYENGKNLIKVGRELRELEVAHVHEGEYSTKLKGDTITLKNRLKVEKGELSEVDAIALEEAAKP